MADSKFGIKRSCTNCEVKFYDLNKKSPLICPQCKQEIIVEYEFNSANEQISIQNHDKTEVKDELTDVENSEDTSGEDDMISLDDAQLEEEENSKN